MYQYIKKIILCLYDAATKTIEHDGIEHSGYMSFMMLVSIFPFIIFFLALTSFVGASNLGEYFIQLLMKNMPDNTVEMVKTRMDEIIHSPPQSLLTLAIFGTIWTSSSFVECIRTVLNRVYNIKSPHTYIRRRLLSILQVLIISIMITFTMFMLVIIPIQLAKMPIMLELIKGYEYILNFLRYIFIITLLFFSASSLYYVIPSASLKYADIIPGAMLSVFLWIISGYLLSTYIVYYNQLSVIYGSVGSIIATLIFFYIINMILIYGAEFNHSIKTIKSNLK